MVSLNEILSTAKFCDNSTMELEKKPPQIIVIFKIPLTIHILSIDVNLIVNIVLF